MYYERIITTRLSKLSKIFPAIIITGARQVGKSTLLAHVFGKNAETVVFDPVIDVENARKDPELFLNNQKVPLILDEIQYAPELVSCIKRRIDKNRSPGQYLMTGSQQWGVLKTMEESLAGRAVFLDLHGFSLSETVNKAKSDNWLDLWLKSPSELLKRNNKLHNLNTTLYEQLWRGWLPEVQNLPADAVSIFQLSYQRTYIERDVRLIADVSDFQLFGRFFRLVSALTSQEINYSQIGRELGLTPQTSKRWLDILKSTYQWFETPAFSGNTIKRISNKPKGYISDTGTVCFSLAISTPQAIGSHPSLGAIFETAVAGEIFKQISTLDIRPNVYHWRSHGGAEVDFILEFDGFYYPIEVKTKSNPTRNDTRGISSFRKTYPDLNIQSGLVIAPTNKIYQISENDYAIPWNINIC